MFLRTLVAATSLAAVSAQLVGPGDVTAALETPGGPDPDAPPPPAATPAPPPPVVAADTAADSDTVVIPDADDDDAPDAAPNDDPDGGDDGGDEAPPQVAAFAAPAPDDDTADGDAAEPEDDDDADPQPAVVTPTATDDVVLEQSSFPVIPEATLVPACGCSNFRRNFEPRVDDIRTLSNKFLKSKGKTSPVYTNMLWSWGQFLDHDFVATSDDKDDDKQFTIDVEGTDMHLERVLHIQRGRCRAPRSTLTPQIDGGPIYSNFAPYTDSTLRMPGGCMLRTSAGDMPPVTTEALTTVGEDGASATKHFFLAGDVRVNEHAILTNMHTIWLREHNRVCGKVEADGATSGMDDDAKFDLVRNVVIAKMQEITLFEWLPALGIAPEDVFHWKPHARLRKTAAISTEFFLLYRWGHLGVPIKVGRWSIDKIFDGEKFMLIDGPQGSSDPAATNAKVDELLEATAGGTMSDLDGRMEESLRSNLFVPGMDLGSRNIFRGREVGVVSYRRLALCYRAFPSPLKGTDDPFIGATAERPVYPGIAFGPTLHNLMLDQFHRVLFGPQGNWWEFKLDVGGYKGEIVGTKLADVIRANSGASVQGSVFIQRGKKAPTAVQTRFDKFGSFSRFKDAKFGRNKSRPSDPKWRPTKGGKGGKGKGKRGL